MNIKNSDNIKDLYSAQLISAEAYLYCLDNNLKTLSDIDIILKSLIPCNTNIKEELSKLTSHPQEDNNDPKLDDSVAHIYCKLKSTYSVRTQNTLNRLEIEYSFPSKAFFDFLLYNKNQDRFKYIRGAGRLTIDELNDLANSVRKKIKGDNVSITKEGEVGHIHSLDVYYQELKSNGSGRAQSALNRLESEYNGDSFVSFLIQQNDLEKNLSSHPGIGCKTINEVSAILRELKQTFITTNIFEGFTSEDIDHTRIFIEDEKENLSARSRNALDKIYIQSGSLIQFCEKILYETYDFTKYDNVGKTSARELDLFAQKLNQFILTGKDDYEAYETLKIEKAFGVSSENARTLYLQSKEMGHFPIFSAINIYMRSLGRDWTIIEGRINIFEKQTIKERDQVAKELKLTSERVRQLQVKAYKNLFSTITLWKNNRMIDHSFYDSACSLEYEHSNLRGINECERVNFNHNFIIKVLHAMFPNEYSLLGDETIAFFNPYNRTSNICLIPQKYSKIYDFKSFRGSVKEQVNTKIYEMLKVDFNSYLLQFFKATIDFEALPEISEICKKIIYNDYGLIVNNGLLIIEQNATKNIPDILEDILDKNNRVMTLDELYNEIEKRYPGMTKDKDALRGSILRNSNIVPIGRSSKYALRKWSSKGIVGGTIRDIVFKFLDESSLPASLEEVTDHVITFRPKTDTKSVYSNLFADTTTRFKFFTYQGLRHVGLSHKEYPAEYLVFLPEEAAQRRTFKESIEALENFIKTNNRFPFSNSTEVEEERLFRFLNIQKGKKKKDNLNCDELQILAELEKKYGHLEISKNDFLWNQNYDEVVQYVAIHSMMPTRRSDLYLYNWIYKQRRALIEGRLNDEQVDKIIELDNNI